MDELLITYPGPSLVPLPLGKLGRIQTYPRWKTLRKDSPIEEHLTAWDSRSYSYWSIPSIRLREQRLSI